MKVLFANLQTNTKKSVGLLRHLAFSLPPPWIAYLAAYIREKGYEVVAIDQIRSNLSYDALLRCVREERPAVLAVSLLTHGATRSLPFLKRVRETIPEVKIVLGHVHANYFADDLLVRDLANVVVHGEGEQTLGELLEAFESRSPLNAVQGISYRDNGTVHRTPARPLISDLDTLPWPAWDLLHVRDYKPFLLIDTRWPYLLILASRGCPYRCLFCSDQFGRTYRVRSMVKVVDEMEHFIDRFGIRQYVFLDANFPLTPDMGIEFCERLVERGLHKRITWTTQMRIDQVDKPLLSAMKKANCTRLFFGIESGTDQGLSALKKDLAVDVIRNRMSLVRTSGIKSIGQFMLGGPGETHTMSEKTIDLACELGFNFVKFPIMIPYPGSEVFETYLKDETFADEDWEKFSMYTGDEPYTTRWLPAGQTKEVLLRMQRRGMIRFYSRPDRLLRLLTESVTFLGSVLWTAIVILMKTLWLPGRFRGR